MLGGGGGNALKLLTRLVRTGIVVVVEDEVDVVGAVVIVDEVVVDVVGLSWGPTGVLVSQATMRAASRSPATRCCASHSPFTGRFMAASTQPAIVAGLAGTSYSY
jgi:hypothetical protein